MIMENDSSTNLNNNLMKDIALPPVSSSSSTTTTSRRKRTRSLACMKIDRVVGSGTFGVVYRAIDKTDCPTSGETTSSGGTGSGSGSNSSGEGTVVALKKIRMERETQGFPVTAIREIKILHMMHHENILHLREVITYMDKDDEKESSIVGKQDLHVGDVFMVFEYVDFDLAGLLKSIKFRLTPAMIKSYTYQLLLGMQYLHEHKVLHRDIKSANLLISRNHVLKIADWGLARLIPPSNRNLTVPVVTLWYRSPELIVGKKQYGPEVDMWSVGCIFGEMHSGSAIFPGDREPKQLEFIFSLLGQPQGAVLEQYRTLPDWDKLCPPFVQTPSLVTKMGKYFDQAGQGISLLSNLLNLDPVARWSAGAALQHEYFTSGPIPRPKDLPPIPVDAIAALPESERQKQDFLAQQQLLAQQRLLQQPMANAAAPGPSRGGPAPTRMGQVQPTAATGPTSPPRGMRGGSAQDARKQMRERHRAENPMLKKFAIVRPAGAAAGASASSASAGNSAGAVAPTGPGAPAVPSVPPPAPSRDGDDPQAKRSRI